MKAEKSTNMDMNSIHEEVNTYIDTLSFELKKFSSLLKFENNALQNRNYDELNQSSEEKTFIIKKIQRVDSALKAVFHDDQSETTLQDYIKSMPNDNHIKTRWAEQMQVLEKCNKQNSENKKLVDQYINEVHSIVDILNTNDSPQVYSKTGMSAYSNTNNISYSNRV